VPGMAFAGKMTGEDLTKEQQRAYSGMAYLFGFRMLEYRPTQGREMAAFELSKGAREEYPGRGTTAGVQRSPAMDARIMEALQRYKEREAAAQPRPKARRSIKGQWEWPPEEEKIGVETIEQIRARALRQQARGK